MKFLFIPKFLLVCFLMIGSLSRFVLAWEKLDYHIFDLHDELTSLKGKDTTFYSVLNLTSSATISEITRAYRKASLEYHPDKNSSKEAERLYTLLTSISAILKDEGQRQVYDGHLKRGIPVWRGGGYYYDRYKPSLPVVLMFLFVFISFTQYISAWGIFAYESWKNHQVHSEVNNLNYTQLKKQLKKAAAAEKINKKDFKGKDNVALLKSLGKLDVLDTKELQKPSLMDLVVIKLPIYLCSSLLRLFSGKTQLQDSPEHQKQS